MVTDSNLAFDLKTTDSNSCVLSCWAGLLSWIWIYIYFHEPAFSSSSTITTRIQLASSGSYKLICNVYTKEYICKQEVASIITLVRPWRMLSLHPCALHFLPQIPWLPCFYPTVRCKALQPAERHPQCCHRREKNNGNILKWKFIETPIYLLVLCVGGAITFQDKQSLL